VTPIAPHKSLVIVPTYNENENIASLVQEIWRHEPQVHILVVDDNSRDGTAQTVQKLQQEHAQQLHLLQRPGKMGLGTAYITGFRWALERGYDAVLTMDADFSHPPHIVPVIIQTLQNYPLVIGSRYIPGGGTENWSLSRRLLSKFGGFYARNILGMPTRDLTGGFNGLRRDLLERFNLDAIRCEGYAFQIELKFRTFQAGFPIKEIPILFSERRAGQSKMSLAIMLEAMTKVWGLRFNPSDVIRAGK